MCLLCYTVLYSRMDAIHYNMLLVKQSSGFNHKALIMCVSGGAVQHVVDHTMSI